MIAIKVGRYVYKNIIKASIPFDLGESIGEEKGLTLYEVKENDDFINVLDYLCGRKLCGDISHYIEKYGIHVKKFYVYNGNRYELASFSKYIEKLTLDADCPFGLPNVKVLTINEDYDVYHDFPEVNSLIIRGCSCILYDLSHFPKLQHLMVQSPNDVINMPNLKSLHIRDTKDMRHAVVTDSVYIEKYSIGDEKFFPGAEIKTKNSVVALK